MVNLINLPQPNSLDDKLDPPLGLMYIASSLRRNGFHVKITDLAFVDRAKWKDEIGYADIYGMTVFSASLHLAQEVAEIARENNRSASVVVGGPHPSSLPESSAEDFDYVVKGEGELALFHLNGARIVEEPQIGDLDLIPAPSRDLLDLSRYTRRVFGYRATSITASRGCPYSCAFCCKDVFGRKVRYFSVDRVISEIEEAKSRWGIRSFLFYDDTFALDRSRFYELCAELGKQKIVYRCNGNARNNTPEDFKVLYDSGCREIAFGVESGSQAILDRINKGATVANNITAVQNAKKAGLLVKVYLMIGNPGESVQTVEDTKEFMEKADPDQFTLFNFVPLPGCDIWNHPDKYGMRIVDPDFSHYYNIAGDYDGGVVMETDSLSRDQLRVLKADLLRYLRNRGQKGQLQDYYEKSAHN